MRDGSYDLVGIYRRNVSRDTDAGWYVEANRQLAERAQALGIDADRFAGIVAATSPQNAWDTASGKTPNLDCAERFVAKGANVHTGVQMSKCRAILAGADPVDVLTGPKERAFYLSRPGATNAVTVDRWMVRAVNHTGSLTAKAYESIANATRDAAARVGVSPDALQAAVWAQVRREAA
jgi:hypothetical protein